MPVEEDINKFKLKVEQALKDLTAEDNLKTFGQDLRDIIVRRTRLGYIVPSTNAPKEKMEALAPSTKKQRKYKQKKGDLSDLTSPNKANLTLTGEMLNSLTSETKQGVISISPKGDRNKKLAAYHQEGNSKMPSRPFLDLSYEDVRQLTVKMQDAFTKILDKIFK